VTKKRAIYYNWEFENVTFSGPVTNFVDCGPDSNRPIRTAPNCHYNCSGHF